MSHTAQYARRHDVDIRREFPAKLEEIDLFCAELRQRLVRAHWKRALFAAELLVREMLNNAVIHGCRNKPAMKVRCRLKITGKCLTIHVADQGAGFDWAHRHEGRKSTTATSGRGLSLLRAYSTELQFNPKGNALTIRRQFG